MSLSAKKFKVENDGALVLPFLVYEWREGVQDEDIDEGYDCLHRVTADMLLPGPTSLQQLKVKVADTKDCIEGEFTPPGTFLSSKRSAVHAAMQLPGVTMANLNADVIQRMHGTARATAAAGAIKAFKKKCGGAWKFRIQLPQGVTVEKRFCNRDDWGNHIRGFKGIHIGIYKHDEAGMQVADQNVYILHCEMASERRDSLDSLQAGTYFNATQHC